MRHRYVFLGVAALTGLVTAVVTGVAAPSAPAAALPSHNLVSNPSFETNLTGWSADRGTLTRVASSAAPNGSWVAQLQWNGTGSSVVLDHSPDAVTASVLGTAYTASAYVAAGNSAAVGHTVSLELDEHSANGTEVTHWLSSAVLGSDFQLVSIVGHARNSGDHLSVSVVDDQPSAAAQIQTDGFALTAQALPPTDQLTNPSFEPAGTGWGAGHATLAVAASHNAPDGSHFAVLTADGSARYSYLSQFPGTVSTTEQENYEAGVFVSGTGASVGRQVQLILRESTAGPDYTYVGETDSALVTLTSRWQQITVDRAAAGTGHVLDAYVTEPQAATGDQLRVDAMSLAPHASTLSDLALEYDQNFKTDHSLALGDTSRYAYVATQQAWGSQMLPDGRTEVAAIHDADPLTKVFAYVNVATTKYRETCPASGNPPYLPWQPGLADADQSFAYGINYCWLNQHNHLDWILHTGCPATTANYARYYDFDDMLPMDVNNPAFRSQVAADVTKAAAADTHPGEQPTESAPFDGVFLDDTNTYPGHHLDAGADGTGSRDDQADSKLVTCTGSTPQPITEGSYGAGMVSTIQRVRAVNPTMTLEANVGVTPWYAWQRTDALLLERSLDYAQREFFVQWDGPCGGYSAMNASTLDGMSDYVRAVQATPQPDTNVATVDYVGGSDGTIDAADRQVMQMSRGQFLMAWDGRSGSVSTVRSCVGDPAAPEWTTDLGLPLGPAETVQSESTANGTARVQLRTYAKGIDITSDYPTPVTVPLTGTFTRPNGQSVSGSVTLPAAVDPGTGRGLPGSAVLLTRTGY